MNILLCWLSWVGKTTFAKQLEKDFWLYCTKSSDDIHTWIRERFPFLRKSEIEINSLEYKVVQALTKTYQTVEIIMRSRDSGLVIDAGNKTKKTRNILSALLPDKPIIIEVTCSDSDLVSRLQRRNNPEIWFDLHMKQKASFEPPINPDIVYNTSTTSYDEIKKRISSLVSNTMT